METRTTTQSRPRLARSADGKPTRIEGYAALYFNAADPGTEYELGRFGSFSVVERLMPGCFDRAIREDDVRALFNHDPDNILGRNKSGTLLLSSDAKGLKYSIDAPNTTVARDLMESLKRSDVSGSSFSFDYIAKSVVEQSLPDGSERDIIEVREVRLYDVGPVTFPAYASTSSEARGRHGRAASASIKLRRVELIERDLAVMCRQDAPAPRRQRPMTSRQRLEADLLDTDVALCRVAMARRTGR